MSAKSRLDAMRTATLAIDGALNQPLLVAELQRHGLLDQFRLASGLLYEETHTEVQRLMAVSDELADRGSDPAGFANSMRAFGG